MNNEEVQLHGWVNIKLEHGIPTHISLELDPGDYHIVADEDGEEKHSLDREGFDIYSEIAYREYPDKDIAT